jgi:hypothetical protein
MCVVQTILLAYPLLRLRAISKERLFLNSTRSSHQRDRHTLDDIEIFQCIRYRNSLLKPSNLTSSVLVSQRQPYLIIDLHHSDIDPLRGCQAVRPGMHFNGGRENADRMQTLEFHAPLSPTGSGLHRFTRHDSTLLLTER